MALLPKRANGAAAITATRLCNSCLHIELLPNITSTILYLWSTVNQFSRGYIYAHCWHIRAQFAHRILHVNIADKALVRKRWSSAIPNNPHYRLLAVNFWSNCCQLSLGTLLSQPSSLWLRHRRALAETLKHNHCNSLNMDGFRTNPAGFQRISYSVLSIGSP